MQEVCAGDAGGVGRRCRGCVLEMQGMCTSDAGDMYQ